MNRLRNRYVLALAGVMLVILGQWLWFEYPLTIRPGSLAALAGMLILLFTVRPAGLVPEPKLLFDRMVARGWISVGRIPFVLAGIGLCIYTGRHAVEETDSVWALMGLWGLSIWLTIYGLVPSHTGWWREVGNSLREQRRVWLIAAGLFLVALIVRTAWLETSPYIMSGDEGAFAVEAVSIKDAWHWEVNPFKYGMWHHPLTFHSLLALSMDLLGQTTAAVRLPSAIFGALTIPAVYFMGRRLFDDRVGLVAAIFLTAYPLHVYFSRTGINQTGDPLFSTLAFAFLTRTLRDGNRMEAALVGLTVGLSQYFYSAARIVPMLMVVYVGLYALVNWRGVWKRSGALIVAFIVACVVMFPNLYAVYQDETRPISPRLASVSIWETGALDAAVDEDRLGEFWKYQITQSFFAYVQTLDESAFYTRYNPVLGWYAGVPFLIGLVVCLRRWRDPRWSILNIWVVMTAILGGVLLVDPPMYPRYISVSPALSLLVAFGIITVSLILKKLFLSLRFLRPRDRMIKWGIPLGMALLLALADQRTYIFDYLPKKLMYGERTVQMNEVAAILDTFHGRYRVVFLSSRELAMAHTSILPYLSPDNRGTEYDGKSIQLGVNYAYVIAPQRLDELPHLFDQAPGGELHEYLNQRTGEPLVYVYQVDASHD